MAQESKPIRGHLKGGLLGLVTIGNQSTDDINQKVGRAAMPGMFNLSLVFQLVVDRFDEHPLAQEEFICEFDQALFHGPLDGSEQFHALLQERGDQGLREIAFISKQRPEESLSHLGDRTAIIDVAWGQGIGEQFPLIVDNQVQLKAIEPAHRVLATLGQSSKDAMLLDPAVVTDDQGGRVHQAQPATAASTRIQVRTQRHEDGRHHADKARVTDQPWKLAPQMHGDILGVIGFEGSIMRLVEMDENGHHFALAQLACPSPCDGSAVQLALVPMGSKRLPEIIDSTEQFE